MAKSGKGRSRSKTIGTRNHQLQDQILNALRRSRSPVAIFLVKGVKLQGTVAGFDSFSIQLRRGGVSQLVYKHAISTIAPAEWPSEIAHSGGEGDDLQSTFLASARQKSSRMILFLVNGVMLDGEIADFDQYCVVLRRGSQGQLIYKHAISTLQPHDQPSGVHDAERDVAKEPAL